MQSPAFYTQHLTKVSRSFAFCIAELKGEFKHFTALSYLLFRVLDTIEDSAWEDKELQVKSFDLFKEIVKNSEIAADKLQQFHAQLRQASMKDVEDELVADFELLLNDLTSLPTSQQEALRSTLVLMSDGMSYFSTELNHQLNSLPRLNLYCYFVAGCIGELLTLEFEKNSEEVFSKAIDFGLFLQKINILKDMKADQEVGRNFISSWEEAVNSLAEHARAAFDYCLLIPDSKLDYKVFCIWSLFLGLASFPYIQKNHLEGKAKKISRLETYSILQKLKSNIAKNDWLTHYFEEQIKVLPSKKAPHSPPQMLIFNQLHPHPKLARFKKFQFA